MSEKTKVEAAVASEAPATPDNVLILKEPFEFHGMKVEKFTFRTKVKTGDFRKVEKMLRAEGMDMAHDINSTLAMGAILAGVSMELVDEMSTMDMNAFCEFANRFLRDTGALPETTT